jgi:hypothetical protein
MWNKDFARKHVVRLLHKKRYPDVRIPFINMFGHAFIKTRFQNFYVIHKKSHFHSFRYQFKQYINSKYGISGDGESINREYLIFCIQKQCKLLFTYQDYEKKIYKLNRHLLKSHLKLVMPGEYSGVLDVALLKNYCEKHGLIRQQEKTNTFATNDYTGSTIQVNEITYSFPFKLLEEYR